MSAPELYDANSLHDAMSVSSTCIESSKIVRKNVQTSYSSRYISSQEAFTLSAACLISRGGVLLVWRGARGFVGLSRHWSPLFSRNALAPGCEARVSDSYSPIPLWGLHDVAWRRKKRHPVSKQLMRWKPARRAFEGKWIWFSDRYARCIIFLFIYFFLNLVLSFLTLFLAASSIGSRN